MTTVTREQREREREDRERLAKLQADDDLRWVASDPRGQRFLERCIYGFGALKVLGHDRDPHILNFNQGQRAVGVALEAQLKRVDRQLWRAMEIARATRIADETPLPDVDADE